MEQMTFTRDELIEALKAKPVTEALAMLEQQGGGPADLADAIIDALTGRDPEPEGWWASRRV